MFHPEPESDSTESSSSSSEDDVNAPGPSKSTQKTITIHLIVLQAREEKVDHRLFAVAVQDVRLESLKWSQVYTLFSFYFDK